MVRCVRTVLVVAVLLGLAASTSAAQKSRKRGQNQDGQGQNSQNLLERFVSGHQGSRVTSVISNFKKNQKDHKPHDEPIPIDPGKGDGKPVDPVVPQGRPGFVWVDDHWERERAPKSPKIVDPAPGGIGPVVRDHRTSSEPIVRDHRKVDTPVVRDHRKSTSVFDAAQSQGTAKSLPWTVTAPPDIVVRDHRTTGKPIIRDHRTTTGPMIRDHRSGSTHGGVSVTTTSDASTAVAKPIVRDHR